jgi:hypothetical protein
LGKQPPRGRGEATSQTLVEKQLRDEEDVKTVGSIAANVGSTNLVKQVDRS